ncbi:hypothetical protein LTR08_005345 [Meristemomyces frigidus]|nr:hypothetical protein LTR08_005345 [Meristemomyces frigidus]
MEARDLFSMDRSIFDTELDNLISAASTAMDSSPPAPSTSTPPSSPYIPSDPRLRNQAATMQGHASKKQKVEEGASITVEPVTPSPSRSVGFTLSEPQSYSPTRLHSDEDLANSGNHSPRVLSPSSARTRHSDAHRIKQVFHDPPVQPQDLPEYGDSPDRPRAPLSSHNDPTSSPSTASAPSFTWPTAAPDASTWATNRNAVQRQWDVRKTDLEYDALLELRRNEHPHQVDRYVPPRGNPEPHRHSVRLRRDAHFPFTALPDRVQTRILELLLVSREPIRIDFTWLRTFVQGHARVPPTATELAHEGETYRIPLPWDRITAGVARMQDDMRPFSFALEERALRTRKRRAPCRGLTTSLLKVSRDVHRRAAAVFYGANSLHFPSPTSAWLQLESLLATIGPVNRGYLHSINIYVPLWSSGVHDDYVEGAILDLTSPVSRLAVIKPPARDRLLAAVRSCVAFLLAAGSLHTLTLELDPYHAAAFCAPTQRYTGHLLAMADAGEFVRRKQEGVGLLKRAGECLPRKPVVRVLGPGQVEWAASKRTFGKADRVVVAAAEEYGWDAAQP